MYLICLQLIRLSVRNFRSIGHVIHSLFFPFMTSPNWMSKVIFQKNSSSQLYIYLYFITITDFFIINKKTVNGFTENVGNIGFYALCGFIPFIPCNHNRLCHTIIAGDIRTVDPIKLFYWVHRKKERVS